MLLYGVIERGKTGSYFEDIDWYSTPVMLMIIGVVIFIIAFFGCCGAIHEDSCMMLVVSRVVSSTCVPCT